MCDFFFPQELNNCAIWEIASSVTDDFIGVDELTVTVALISYLKT